MLLVVTHSSMQMNKHWANGVSAGRINFYFLFLIVYQDKIIKKKNKKKHISYISVYVSDEYNISDRNIFQSRLNTFLNTVKHDWTASSLVPFVSAHVDYCFLRSTTYFSLICSLTTLHNHTHRLTYHMLVNTFKR